MADLPAGFVLDAPPAATAPPGPVFGPARMPPAPPQSPAPPNSYTQGQDDFANVMKLRDDYNADPSVKSYRVAVQQMAQALNTGEGPQNDLALTYAFAKAMDPDSVVRDAEQGLQIESQPWFQARVEAIKKQFGVDDAGTFTPEARRALRQQIISSVKTRDQLYNGRRDYYRQFAEKYGYDPTDVLGEHDGAPFRAQFEAYDRAQKGAARDVEMRGGVPIGTEVEFNIDAPEGPFDRNEYLQERYGIDPNQEATATAFWNANSGNANLTVEAAKEWYAGKGLAPPADADLARAVDDAKAGKQFGGINTEAAEKGYISGLDQVLELRGAKPESIPGAVGAKAVQGIMWGGLDEAAGLGGFLGAAIRGDNPVAGYQAERDIIRREQARAYEAHPYVSTGAELGGGLLTGGAGFRTPARAGALARQASAMGNTPRASILQRQAVRGAAAAGARTGALAGFNYGEGPVGSPVGALVGAGAGATLAGLTQAVAPRVGALFDRRATATSDQQDVLAAGDRLGVTVRPADIIPEVRNQRSVLLTREEPGATIRAAEATDLQDAEAAVARGVAGGRASVDRDGVGATGRAALERHGNATRDEARAQYTRAANAAGNTRAEPKEAVYRLAGHIVRLEEAGANENAATIKYLTGLGEDFSKPGGLSIQAMRDKRTNMRANIKNAGLDVDRTEAIVLDVLDAASADIQRALAGNKKALDAYRRGDEIWRERAQFRQEVTRQLLGPRNQPKSDENVATGIARLARDDFTRFQRMWGVLEPEEQADVAATFALGLGRNGQEGFSLQRFLTATTGSGMGSKASISPRAMKLMFGDDGMRAIRDLQTLARAKGDAAAQTNRSSTGNIMQATGRGLRNLILASFGAMVGDISGAVVAPAAGSFMSRMGERRATRLLLNPDFTRWLRQVPNTASPRQINRQFEKLDSIAARSPAMTADIEAMKQALVSAVNDNPPVLRSAAENQNADEGKRNAQ
jgi:hypothetical protein